MTRARSLSQLANANAFTVSGSNNVGIGSTIPDAKLDVGGDIVVGTAITIGSVSGIISATDFYVDGISITGAAGTWATFTSGGEGGISTTKKVKIENGLEVTGVSTFSGDLTVGGVLTYDDVTNVDSIGIITARDNIELSGENANIGFTDASGSESVIRSRYNLTLSADYLAEQGSLYSNLIFKTDGSEKLRISSSGNVGIGTDNPGRLLQVHNASSNPQVNIKSANGGTCELQFGDIADDVRGNIVYNCTDNYLAFHGFNNAERLRIGSAGQIGLGGANYGTAGQVLTSNGSGSAVSWEDASGGGGITTEAATPSNAVVQINLTDATDHKITATGICTITSTTAGTEGQSHTIRIVNSGIATVGFSTYFLFPSGSVPSLPTADGAVSIISFTVHDSVGAGCTQLLAGASLNFS